MAHVVNIGVSSWIIQDGNYEDFHVGQELRCALEFWLPNRLRRLRGEHSRCLSPAGGAELYDVVARVSFRADEVWVLDCGIKLYREEPPPKGLVVGNFVHGTVAIGVDPFFYKEYLHQLPGIPNLSYDFLIERIRLETTPWTTTFGVGRRMRGARTFDDVRRTNAWSDDGGNAHYVLTCRYEE